jgi:hypothetical protein
MIDQRQLLQSPKIRVAGAAMRTDNVVTFVEQGLREVRSILTRYSCNQSSAQPTSSNCRPEFAGALLATIRRPILRAMFNDGSRSYRLQAQTAA